MIATDNFTKRYGDVVALEGLDLEVPAGGPWLASRTSSRAAARGITSISPSPRPGTCGISRSGSRRR
ncbi:hypothetical protein D8Y22_08980 [Salinadaptatus halalkaliphilus]|uniref:Uncharacterized protein n=1 Tax=Salinadaptatus halalkaliphilus TaxID=2419781 RepID=A0A4S3TQ05_9EURY|nr:hypothetical protein [Salinadaptatus halalkaliphilus]THE65313.1 hypothetical protein D8Y22_08980 [Salinadaptatus halalkaliphilus]